MLKSHQSVHNTQRGFTCQACEKWFPTRTALVRHERTDTGEKPFGCNSRHRAFAQKEILLRHLMTHSGRQKPFQCQHCEKSFTQREALKIHIRVAIKNLILMIFNYIIVNCVQKLSVRPQV